LAHGTAAEPPKSYALSACAALVDTRDLSSLDHRNPMVILIR